MYGLFVCSPANPCSPNLPKPPTHPRQFILGNTGFEAASISHQPSNADLLLRGVRSVRSMGNLLSRGGSIPGRPLSRGGSSTGAGASPGGSPLTRSSPQEADEDDAVAAGGAAAAGEKSSSSIAAGE